MDTFCKKNNYTAHEYDRFPSFCYGKLKSYYFCPNACMHVHVAVIAIAYMHA